MSHARARRRDHLPIRRASRRPERPEEAAARRRRLGRARRHLEAFETSNPYQSLLKGTALAMVGYLEEHWRVPGAGDHFDRWWPIVNRYARALATDDFTGRGVRKRLYRLLDMNQERPSEL